MILTGYQDMVSSSKLFLNVTLHLIEKCQLSLVLLSKEKFEFVPDCYEMFQRCPYWRPKW